MWCVRLFFVYLHILFQTKDVKVEFGMNVLFSTEGLIRNPYIKTVLFIIIGGFAYCGIEVLTRGYSHISMFFTGGLCFLLVGGISYWLGENVPLVVKMLLGAFIITMAELITGLIVNVWLDLGVWDYSRQRFNYMGQICLMFSAMWFLLSLPIIGVYRVVDRIL